MISQYWFSFLNNLGSWPCERNMETVYIFDDWDGKGLDIGLDGEYIFQNGNIIRLNIYPKNWERTWSRLLRNIIDVRNGEKNKK